MKVFSVRNRYLIFTSLFKLDRDKQYEEKKRDKFYVEIELIYCLLSH